MEQMATLSYVAQDNRSYWRTSKQLLELPPRQATAKHHKGAQLKAQWFFWEPE